MFYLFSPALLYARFALAWPFYKSGLTKLTYFQNDQLDTLYFLFEDYNVPFLPVKVAAWMGTFAELLFPILLIMGIFTRFSALGVIGLSFVIYLADQNPDTLQWTALAALIFMNGAGALSIDRLLQKYICHK
ncbi:MAG: DoxX family protein [Pseudomonadota bacterium]